MSRLRVSAISYLNTAPLMWDFARGPRREELRKKFEVEYTIPSRCAQAVAEGAADIGIIPVAAYATIPGLRVLPNIAIASKGAVRSILLVSNCSLDRVRSVALDSSSRASAALVQILFTRHYRRDTQFVSMRPQLDAMLAEHDAALIIGDLALQVDRSRYQTWDLGEEWRRFTGKPFVFAFWAVRAGAAPDEELARIAEVFRESRDVGLGNIDVIADEWSPKLSLPRDFVRHYLARNIDYDLDAENIEGMQLFFRYAAELGILPVAPELRLVRELQSRNSAFSNRV